MRRTAVINQIRGLLLERGITLRKGRHHVDAALPLILEDADANLSGAVRLLLTQLKLDLDQLSVRIDEADAVIQKTAHENEACRGLVAIPGIGPVITFGLRRSGGPYIPHSPSMGSKLQMSFRRALHYCSPPFAS